MTEPSFTARLRAACAADWDAAITHRFVRELSAGSVPPAVMRHYLVQDYLFIDRFVALLGAAIATADSYAARLRLAGFLAMIVSDENTYFTRALDALAVPPEQRTAAPEPAVRAFQDLMAEAAATRSYAGALSVLVVAEWLYLSWAERHQGPLPSDFVHAEWITLHDNPFFRDFVAWLRGELDRAATGLDAAGLAACESLFRRAVALERAFFESLYDAAG
ncbi:TenA family protein [Roseomonas sp. ACRSG]|nr:TenA family protein [Roseomonas sp. ACRSG]